MAWERPKKFESHKNQLRKFVTFQLPFYKEREIKEKLATKQVEFKDLPFWDRVKIAMSGRPQDIIPNKKEIRMKGLYMHQKPKKVEGGISVQDETFLTLKIDELTAFIERIGLYYEFADPKRGRLFLIKAIGFRQKSGKIRHQLFLCDWEGYIDNTYRGDLIPLQDMTEFYEAGFDDDGNLKKN